MQERRAQFGLFRRHRVTDAIPRFRRKPLFEALESRLLLSADVATPAIADAIAHGVQSVGQKIQDYVASDPLLNQALPIIVTAAGSGADTKTVAAKVSNLLSISVDINGNGNLDPGAETTLNGFDANHDGKVDFNEAFGGQLVDKIVSQLSAHSDNSTQFLNFLDNLDTTAGPFSLKVNAPTDTSNAHEVSFQAPIELDFTTSVPIDLGLGADALGLHFPSANLSVQAAL